MASKSCTDEEFIAIFKEHGPSKTAGIIGIDVRNVLKRRRNLERRLDAPIVGPNAAGGIPRDQPEAVYPKRLPLKIDNGTVIIGSDAHYWPGEPSTAHRGIVYFTKLLQPKIFILNGDVFDGAKISRHPPIGWANPPSPKEEMEAVDLRLDEIRACLSANTDFIWTMGNHDARFENRLSEKAGDYSGIKGFTFSDHFPHWRMCISAWINDDVVIKHRFKSGIHATHQNTVAAGRTIVTGHLHSLKVTPFDDYDGTRWGIDTGTLADPYGEQFAYAEDNPLNHRSGFIVLTFVGGQLLWPEIARVMGPGLIDFRGEITKV